MRWCDFLAVALLMVFTWTAVTGQQSESKTRPNVLILIADDLGIGDVGCFGNTTLRTPHIDSICRRGAKLSQHLAQEAVCTPSRAAFLTGRYPVRTGIATDVVARIFNKLPVTGGLPPNETTFAKVFQQSGYRTGLVGKWHLGLHCETRHDFCHHPNKHGFDFFYGTPMSNTKILGGDGIWLVWNLQVQLVQRYLPQVIGVLVLLFVLWKIIGKWAGVIILLPAVLYPLGIIFLLLGPRIAGVFMRNMEVVEQPLNFENMTQRLVNEGQGFLAETQQDGKPFLLVMSWLQVHPVLHAAKPFKGQSQHGPYGDEVEEMDWSVGQMLQALDDLGLADNTLVYFTSDHGAHMEETDLQGRREGGYNGIYKGSKSQASQEGGIRVAAAIMMPGQIRAGVDISTPTALMDIYPTLLELIGAPLPRDRVVDGRSLWPLLKGHTDRSPHQVLFHYCGLKMFAARLIPESGSSVFKLHYVWPRWLPGTTTCNFLCSCKDHDWLETPRLFDVTSDPTESHPLDITQAPYSEVVTQIEQAVKTHKEGVEPVVDQFDWSHSVFRPWLQPCCKLPFCGCSEY